jgi:hypothetical protein
LVAEIQAFKDRVKAIVSRDEDSSRVYHLNLELFPGSEDVAPLRGRSLDRSGTGTGGTDDGRNEGGGTADSAAGEGA